MVTHTSDAIDETKPVTGSPTTESVRENFAAAKAAIAQLELTAGVGPVGPKGDAATVTVGTVTTGTPTQLAQITNVGTPNAAILNFRIPQGREGVATGDTLIFDRMLPDHDLGNVGEVCVTPTGVYRKVANVNQDLRCKYRDSAGGNFPLFEFDGIWLNQGPNTTQSISAGVGNGNWYRQQRPIVRNSIKHHYLLYWTTWSSGPGYWWVADELTKDNGNGPVMYLQAAHTAVPPSANFHSSTAGMWRFQSVSSGNNPFGIQLNIIRLSPEADASTDGMDWDVPPSYWEPIALFADVVDAVNASWPAGGLLITDYNLVVSSDGNEHKSINISVRNSTLPGNALMLGTSAEGAAGLYAKANRTSIQAQTVSGTTATLALTMSLSDYFTIALNSSATVDIRLATAVANTVRTGYARTIRLRLTPNAAGRQITWFIGGDAPAVVHWRDNAPPDVSENGVPVFVELTTFDQRETWFGEWWK